MSSFICDLDNDGGKAQHPFSQTNAWSRLQCKGSRETRTLLSDVSACALEIICTVYFYSKRQNLIIV